jgi:hypothetical protein
VRVDVLSMNRLIRQRAKDAGINLLLTNNDKLEKFAKLIIEECTKVCETGIVDGWQIDSGLSAAFSTEIKNRFKQFEVDK